MGRVVKAKYRAETLVTQFRRWMACRVGCRKFEEDRAN